MTNEESIRNPYNPQAPTTNPGMFFGREDVFAFIRQRLIAGRRPQAIGIIGQRGMGKTSVLWQVVRQIENRYITAYLDLGDVRFDEVGGLFAAMADTARQALDDAGVSTYRLPPIPEDPDVDLWAWFSETYLDVTLSALRNNRRLIFLFDETSKLLDAIDRGDVPAGLDATISLLIGRDDRMDIIFAVDAEDEHRLETFSPLNDPMLHKRLNLLDPASSEALIRRPAAPYYEVGDEAFEGIMAMTGGHPFLLHTVCGLLWERAIEHSLSTLTLDDVIIVMKQATDEADAVLRLAWSRSTANERLALSALTALTTTTRGMPVRAEDVRLWLIRESERPLDETSLAAALRRLEYREVLRAPTKNTYTFTNGLQHQWLVLNGDVQPPMPIVRAERPAPRRIAIPIALVMILAVVLALVGGRAVTTRGPVDTDNTPNPATVTLDQNVLATQLLVAATQTRAFAASPTPIPLLTNTSQPSPGSAAIVDSSATLADTPDSRPTDVVITITFPPSRTPSATPTVQNSITPSDTERQTARPTLTPTTTPPPLCRDTPASLIPPPVFPTGQLHATSTFSP